MTPLLLSSDYLDLLCSQSFIIFKNRLLILNPVFPTFWFLWIWQLIVGFGKLSARGIIVSCPFMFLVCLNCDLHTCWYGCIFRFLFGDLPSGQSSPEDSIHSRARSMLLLGTLIYYVLRVWVLWPQTVTIQAEEKGSLNTSEFLQNNLGNIIMLSLCQNYCLVA